MTFDLSPAIVAVVQILLTQYLPVIAALVATGLLLLLFRALQWFKGKLTAQQLATIKAFVDSVVLAVEQTSLKSDFVNSATAKKTEALTRLQQILDNAGLSGIDLTLLDTLIEASVFDQFNRFDWQTGTIAVSGPAPTSPPADSPSPEFSRANAQNSLGRFDLPSFL